MLLLEIEKKENKTLKTFQKLLEQISQSPPLQSEQAELNSRGNVYEEIDQKTTYTYLEILVGYHT